VVGIIIVVAVALAGLIPAIVLGAAKIGEVGGPPTLKLGPPDEGKRRSPALVIGRGQTFSGPLEIVAYGWLAPKDTVGAGASGKQFCVWTESLPDEISFGTCDLPLTEGPISVDSGGGRIGPPKDRFTEVGGRLSPEVKTVRLDFRRSPDGRLLHVKAIVAQVDGELRRRLKQSARFGYFTARIRGTVATGAFRARAFDSAGNEIGQSRFGD
jgi:hypothetical protein